jgi:hypothetical protein
MKPLVTIADSSPLLQSCLPIRLLSAPTVNPTRCFAPGTRTVLRDWYPWHRETPASDCGHNRLVTCHSVLHPLDTVQFPLAGLRTSLVHRVKRDRRNARPLLQMGNQRFRIPQQLSALQSEPRPERRKTLASLFFGSFVTGNDACLLRPEGRSAELKPVVP